MPISPKENEAWVLALTRDTTEASGIIACHWNDPGMPEWARKRLLSAHAHLFAAMYFDFIIRADGQILDVDGVTMSSGEIKSTRQFLMDDIVERQLAQLPGDDLSEAQFKDPIRHKIIALMVAREQRIANAR